MPPRFFFLLANQLFVDNLIDQMNDAKESREREAKRTEVEEMVVEEEELPSWKVP